MLPTSARCLLLYVLGTLTTAACGASAKPPTTLPAPPPPTAAAPAPSLPAAAASWRVPAQIRRWRENGIDTLGRYPGALSQLAAGDAWFLEPDEQLDAARLRALLEDVVTYQVPGVSLRGQVLPPGSLELLRTAPELRALDLSETAVGDAELLALPAGLRRLYLAGTAITDASAASWTPRAQLEVVDVSGTRVGDATLEALRAASKSLKALALAGTRVSDSSAGVLSSFTSLVILDLNRTRTGRLTAAAVGQLPLRELYLGETDAAAAAGQLAPLAATLTILDLSGAPAGDAQLGWIGRAVRLRSVYLGDTAAGDATLRALAQLPGLRVLELTGVPASAPALATLAQSPTLEDLDLADTVASEALVTALLGRATLRRLRLDGTTFTDRALRVAPAGLRELYLARTKITDAGLAALGPLAELEALGLAETSISERSAPRIAALTSLRTLILDGAQWSDAGYAALGALTELERLHLERTRLDDAGLAALANLRRLRALYLQDTDVSDAGLVIAHAFTDLEELTIGDTRVSKIVDSLAAWPKLRLLSLYGLPVSDGALPRLVAAHPRLQLLNLGATELTDPTALARLPELRALGLDETHVGDRSFAGLAAAARLAELSLAGCTISAAALPDLLKLPALQRLDVRGTPLAPPPPSGADPLMAFVRRGVIVVRADEGM